MLKILWKRGEIAPEEQFLLLPTIFCYLMLDFYVKTGIRFSLRDKRLFEITKVMITKVDCIMKFPHCLTAESAWLQENVKNALERDNCFESCYLGGPFVSFLVASCVSQLPQWVAV